MYTGISEGSPRSLPPPWAQADFPLMTAPVPTSPTPRPTASRREAASRDESLDIAKGFGIILVVLGHCLLGLINSQFFSTPVAWPAATVYTIYAFHMPLFFVISGHLASGKLRPAGVTIRKLIPTIVYPYFLWSIVQGLTQVYMTKYTSSHVPISALYKILWIPIVPYWFLYALFFCHLGYLVIRRLPFAAQMAIAACLYLLALLVFRRFGLIFPLIVMETTRAFVFFVLGVITVNQVRRFGWKAALAATLLFVASAVVFYRMPWLDTTLAVVSVITACAGIVATLAWSRFFALRPNLLIKTLGFLGRYSMSIYVIHILLTAGVRIVMKRLGAHDSLGFTIAEIVAGTTFGIVVPLIVNWAVSKLSVERWFGLQKMETA